MTLTEFYENFNLEDYKKANGTTMSKLNLFFVNNWSSETTYTAGEEVIYLQNYIKYIYSSLQDNNLNNLPTLKEYWSKEEKDASRYITDEELNNQLLIVIKFFDELCKRRYCEMTPMLIEFFNCLLSVFVLSYINTDNSATLIMSESIDGMSIGKDANEFYKKYPLFNNVYGARFYLLYTFLFPINLDLYGCIENKTYDYFE